MPSSPSLLDRRTLLKAASCLPLAAVLDNPVLAATAARALEAVTITLPSGKSVAAALALPQMHPQATPAPGIILVHEWWGLNDQIKAVAGELARLGYAALAIDLYGGVVATTPQDARRAMQAVDQAQARETIAAWPAWLAGHAACNGRLASVGWCFGGGWSLDTALAAGLRGAVVYYGNVARNAQQLAALKGPVLGHFATRDSWITRDMVEKFQAAMRDAGKEARVYWYEADHAFANPTGAHYDQPDAQLAWQRTLAFFNETIGPAPTPD
jgi:carboxymethylenebutenolidase